MRKLNLFLILLLVFVLAALPPLTTYALNILPRTSLGIEEETAASQKEIFALPDSIYITPIFLETSDFITDTDWYKGLYYYQTYRLNQGDFLFHYLVTGDGSVLQGNIKGEDQRFQFLGLQTKPIVIAYFARSDDIDFNVAAKSKLADLILDLANRNTIPLNQVFVSNIEYVAKPNEVISARLTPIVGRWERSLKDMVNSVSANYNPTGRNYALQVASVELPANPVNYGDNVIVNITIKNNSNYLLYQGSDYEPLVAKTEGNFSRFYLNGVWLSQTQAPLMQEGTYLKPNESKAFQLRLAVPLNFGEQEESFQLINSLGKAYPETQFTIKLNINRLNKEVIEITPTETGQLNVRENPWGSANVITRVSPGQRFVVLERTDAGWVKLDLGGGQVGWVVVKYTKLV